MGPLDVESEDKPEPVGKASIQPEVQAQAKEPIATTSEPTRKRPLGIPTTRQTRSQTRQLRTVYQCDSEEPPAKGPEPPVIRQATKLTLLTYTDGAWATRDQLPQTIAEPSEDAGSDRSGSLGDGPQGEELDGLRPEGDGDHIDYVDTPYDPDSPTINGRNEGYPKYFVDEFEDLSDHMTVYVRYRIAGGKMKFREEDTGAEAHYEAWPGIELQDIGERAQDFNNIAPCEWTMSHKEYANWHLSTHPKPVDVKEATRYWLDRRHQLHRRQHPAPGSYEQFLLAKAGYRENSKDVGYDYISAPGDTWDNGSLYRMHMIR